jgi:hypothetical protein
MCGKNNFVLTFQKGKEKIIFRKSFTRMKFELTLKKEGVGTLFKKESHSSPREVDKE